MKILGIESSSLTASVAVVTDEAVTGEFTIDYKKTHSQTLLPMLDEMGKMIDLDLRTLDAIAAAAGPGSFTGLRIGAATAKGLGLALGKPLIAVPTLEAMAYNLWGCAGLVCPLMDARRNQAYTAVYRMTGPRGAEGAIAAADCGRAGVLSAVVEPCAMPVADLIRFLNGTGEPVTFLGDGVPVFREVIRENMTVPAFFAPPHCAGQRAASVAALGLEYAKAGRMVTAAEFKPDYLRKPQAEREREARMEAERSLGAGKPRGPEEFSGPGKAPGQEAAL